jgi:hypothetical protein
MAWIGQQRFEVGVLSIGKFVAMHGKPPSGNSPAPELGLLELYT